MSLPMSNATVVDDFDDLSVYLPSFCSFLFSKNDTTTLRNSEICQKHNDGLTKIANESYLFDPSFHDQ